MKFHLPLKYYFDQPDLWTLQEDIEIVKTFPDNILVENIYYLIRFFEKAENY